ncbi:MULTISPECIES: helix-turn-helix domain-containing protein [Sphingobacterium]|uniref:AraC family transcriptional regulator n=1 Tax=Sphingobacterium athyrii TaxID=2152717 RepID=A0A363NTD4_9SPHI|nr:MULTISPECIES: AraC family transcriptional regulator [Sphingobacterium]PUV23988.1 AraC family transcriptional regulator [Sphingobacterium athyrii]QIH34244.1 helix-turn-helix transcriptional regulator [Sphingobacterium sp. DR205]
MNIEFLNSDRKQLISSLKEPEGYLIPQEQNIIETLDFKNGKELYEERKRIHLDGVYINFYKRSSAEERVIWVRSDAPYIQMHFEISGGSAYYYHKNKKFAVLTSKGEFNTFYVPYLDGKLIDPPCKNATTVEIEFSESWIREHIGDASSLTMNFVDDIAAHRPSLLGGKAHIITPQISKTISELYECPYTGHIKRLYLEAKLMELLAHQLHGVHAIANINQLNKLSKLNIENLHFIKEMLISNLAKNYTIEELSYLSMMNRTKLQAGFKELFGHTIHDFIVQKRMQLAYHLLTESYANHWNISEIARRVGYLRSNHFSAAFKKEFGVSPGRFLKNKIE